jgi:hypothetical protein
MPEQTCQTCRFYLLPPFETRGICRADRVPEPVTELRIMRRAGPGQPWERVVSPDIRASLIVPPDHSCSCWQEAEGGHAVGAVRGVGDLPAPEE